MEQSQHPEKSPALQAGRLEGINLPDLLWALCQEKRTGVLCLSRAEREKTVFISEGRIVFANSSDPDDRLGELLLRLGMITLEQLDEGLANLHSGKRLGTLLVEAGSLASDQLVRGVLTQVESIVLDLFTWEEGDYRFDDGPLPTDEVITLEMKTGEILLRGIRSVRSFNRMRRSVGPAHQTYGLVPGWEQALEGLALSEGEELLLERLRIGDESIEQLCREVFLSNFEIYQTLWGLKVLGAIQQCEALTESPSEATLEGELCDTGFDELLVRLGRERETGVLYVSRQDFERTFHVQEGRCVFATSSDTEDGLVSFLLRRGVISLRDREETEKRLLSNKRVGTILWELGVIDERDLREMVRQQIGEIVYDTFNWEDAHYAFIAGPLPSNEQITLEESLDLLVASGVRRVTSWNHVVRGCGGLDTPLGLHRSYLDVLDSMTAGEDEWQVLSALSSVKTPRQLCREVELGDFRTCQILWALKALGAIEIRPEEELARDDAQATEEEEDEHLGEPRTIEVIELDEPPADPSPEDEKTEIPVVEVEPEEQVEKVARVDEEAVVETPRLEVESVNGIEEAVAAEVQFVEIESEDEVEEIVATETPRIEVESEERVGEAVAAETPYEEIEAEPALSDATQAIPRDVVEDALRQPDAPENPVEEDHWAGSTQIIPRDVVEATLSGEPPADETQVIPRGLIDRAIAAGESHQGGEAAAPGSYEPPYELDTMIARFNAMQRLVYRTVRAEVGAGAANFVRACCEQLAEGHSQSLQEAELRADGSWDTEILRQAVVEHRVDDPWADYQRLIEIEIDVLRQHIGETRAVELQRQVESIEVPGSAAP